jgi:hypothetical protein
MTAAVTRHYGVCGERQRGLRSSLNGDLSHSGVKQNQYFTQLGTSVFEIFLKQHKSFHTAQEATQVIWCTFFFFISYSQVIIAINNIQFPDKYYQTDFLDGSA